MTRHWAVLLVCVLLGVPVAALRSWKGVTAGDVAPLVLLAGRESSPEDVLTAAWVFRPDDCWRCSFFSDAVRAVASQEDSGERFQFIAVVVAQEEPPWL